MSDAKVLLLTAVVVGVMLLYIYWQTRARPGHWIPDDAREQINRERRVPPRITCEMNVYILAGSRSVSGVAQNVAIGGLLLIPSAPLSVGEPVHVSFELPKGPRIDIPGAICRTQGNSVAVKFDFVSNQRELIQKWVDQQLRTST
jgi:hypothetical protein